jgi:hypothetical protein
MPGVFDTTAYSPAIQALLAPQQLPELGPGTSNHFAQTALQALTIESVGDRCTNRPMALACISGLWLLHDFLDESHRISQELQTPTGSYWHGIMHRREPDPDNAKYWFRHVGQHPVFDLLTEAMGERWDPCGFIDRCEACRGTGSQAEADCRRIQLREWQVLFDWCFRRAAGM